MNDYLIIGKIIGAHGVRGELKVFPLTDDARRFLKLHDCFICDENLGKLQAAETISSRLDKDTVLVKLKDYGDRTVAETLRGSFIAVSRSNAVRLPKNRFFIADLVGLSVTDDERGPLGTVCDCYETGANYILEVKRSGKNQNLLIPFIRTVCYEVNLDDGIMKCRLPEGLFELYE